MKAIYFTGVKFIMIKTQLIRDRKKPVAVIIDYKEYIRLKELERFH
jgi:hypothetical protein